MASQKDFKDRQPSSWRTTANSIYLKSNATRGTSGEDGHSLNLTNVTDSISHLQNCIFILCWCPEIQIKPNILFVLFCTWKKNQPKSYTDLFFACNKLKTTINYIFGLVSQQVINDYLIHVLFIIILYQIDKKNCLMYDPS